jgi:hypothetical protein
MNDLYYNISYIVWFRPGKNLLTQINYAPLNTELHTKEIHHETGPLAVSLRVVHQGGVDERGT